MKCRKESLKWRDTWETRRLEGNALKGTWVWVDNAMQLFKRRSNATTIKYQNFTLIYLCTLRNDTTTNHKIHYTTPVTTSLMLPYIWLEVEHLKNGEK